MTRHRRRTPSAPAAALAAGALVFLLAVFAWPTAPARARPAPAGRAAPPAPATAVAPAAATPPRQALPAEPAAAVAPAEAFADLLRALVEQSLAWRRAQDGRTQEQRAQQDGAPEHRAAELWSRLRAWPGAAGEALAHWHPGDGTLAARDAEARDVQRRFCARLIADGLAEAWQRHRAGGDRGALDALALGALTALRSDAESVARLRGVLVDQPYLGAAHEDEVLSLVEAAGGEPHLADAAVALLLTLWRNLAAQGSRTPEEILALALLFEQDANPARRLAALRTLLTAHGGRYRHVVVQRLLATGDAAAAREVATAAAAELPPDEALAVLRQLTPVGGEAVQGALLLLAHREPAALARAYDHELAAGRDVALRRALVTGAGFQGGEAGIALARTAFHHDPDASVRARALFALTAHAGAALGEQTLMAALDDRAFSDDPGRLGQIALALENLARTGDANAIDRVARRLLARPGLGEDAKARIAALLERTLPAGR